ncbi:histidine phosphatase family protein [Hymenobacter ruricola]|uniref:Histidine phosphatase family protein n=1 Tax=Hymenobacter ruricola TaxID=2791023 RepID=A0ABS0I0Q2_9BACT|nr:phosphoglycerate mutase family protein [Hymenobacter ruricola]MBF9220527.1 histidine phosphatase family protein [Hymenobacter ruricola]
MTALRLLAALFLSSALALSGCSSKKYVPPTPPVPVTTVYLVRHAEKDNASNPADPTLSVAGEARAQELSKVLAGTTPAALFTTDFKRTRATLAPLAAATGVVPQLYDALQPVTLAALIRTQYAGRTVVVVGHSNTLLPQIEALGVARPVADIAESEYNYLFKVSMADGAAPAVTVSKYGQ